MSHQYFHLDSELRAAAGNFTSRERRFEPRPQGPQPCTHLWWSVRYQVPRSIVTPLRYGGHRGGCWGHLHINLSLSLVWFIAGPSRTLFWITGYGCRFLVQITILEMDQKIHFVKRPFIVRDAYGATICYINRICG